jgi:hypothetical protein
MMCRPGNALDGLGPAIPLGADPGEARVAAFKPSWRMM